MIVDDITPPIAGLHLRYLLTLHLFDAGESTIGDLVAAVGRQTQSWMRQRLRSLRLDVARPPEPVALPPMWSRVQPPSDNCGATEGGSAPLARVTPACGWLRDGHRDE